MFIDKQHKVFVVFYVDNVQVLYHRDDLAYAQAIITDLNQAYDLRELGDVEWFLGIRVIRDRAAKTLSLVHNTYIKKIIKRF